MVASDGKDLEETKKFSGHTFGLQMKFEARAYWKQSRSTTNSYRTFGHAYTPTHRRLVSHYHVLSKFLPWADHSIIRADAYPMLNIYTTRVGIQILVHGLWKMWILFEQNKIKLWNKWQAVENWPQIMQHIFKMQ